MTKKMKPSYLMVTYLDESKENTKLQKGLRMNTLGSVSSFFFLSHWLMMTQFCIPPSWCLLRALTDHSPHGLDSSTCRYGKQFLEIKGRWKVGKEAFTPWSESGSQPTYKLWHLEQFSLPFFTFSFTSISSSVKWKPMPYHMGLQRLRDKCLS